MRQIYISISVLLLMVGINSNLVLGQTEVKWKTLAKIDYDNRFEEDLGYQVAYPIFDPQIKDLNGKEVQLKGYIIPLDEETGYFAFSAYPYESCFFCGAAGLETVMEVYAKKKVKFTTEAVTLRGRLELNDKDMLNHLIYILRDAKVVK